MAEFFDINGDRREDMVDKQGSGLEEEQEQTEAAALPAPLASIRDKRCILGVGFLVVCAGFALALRDARVLSLGLFGIYILYCGMTVPIQFAKGNIVELILVCVAVRKAGIRDQVSVDFVSPDTDGEGSTHYRFTYPGKNAVDDFLPNAVYLVYVDRRDPDRLLTYRLVG